MNYADSLILFIFVSFTEFETVNKNTVAILGGRLVKLKGADAMVFGSHSCRATNQYLSFVLFLKISFRSSFILILV